MSRPCKSFNSPLVRENLLPLRRMHEDTILLKGPNIPKWNRPCFELDQITPTEAKIETLDRRIFGGLREQV